MCSALRTINELLVFLLFFTLNIPFKTELWETFYREREQEKAYEVVRVCLVELEPLWR